MSVKITDLGAVTLPLTGDEVLEIVQTIAGVVQSRKVTVNDLAGATPGLDATFVTATANIGLANERILTAGTGISVVDGGAGNPITINNTVPAPAAGNLPLPTVDGAALFANFAGSDWNEFPNVVYEEGVNFGAPAGPGNILTITNTNVAKSGIRFLVPGIEDLLIYADDTDFTSKIQTQAMSVDAPSGWRFNDVMRAAYTSNVSNIEFSDQAGSKQISTSVSGGNLEIVASAGLADLALIDGTGLLVEEKAAARASVAAFGQIWVRDDTPNVLIYTNDAGTDFVLSGAGGAESQLVDGAANIAVIAEGAGLVGIRSTDNVDASVRRIRFEHQDGTLRGSLGQTTSNLTLENDIDGAEVRLRFSDSGGTPYTFLSADPDSIVALGVPSGGSVRLTDLDTGDPLLIGIPTLGVSLYENAVRKFATRTNGVEVFGASNSPGDGGLVVFSTLSGTPQGYIGHNSSIALSVENQIHGGLIVLSAENAGGSLTNIFVGSPDGPTATYYTGLARLTTDASGVVTVLSDGNTDTEGRRIIFAHANGTERGMLGYTSVGDLFLINRIHGSPVRIQAEDTGGTAREILNADPDTNTILYAAGVATVTLTSTGVTVSTGQITTPSGSAGAPAYAFVSDPDMGIYRSGSGVMAFSIGGTNRLNFNSTGFRLLGPPIYITEQAAANADSPGLGQLWVKNTTPCELWFTSDTGVDTKLA